MPRETSMDIVETADTDTLIQEEYLRPKPRRSRYRNCRPWTLNIVLLLSLIILNAMSWIRGRDSPVSCLERHYTYSPALEAVDDEYRITSMQNTKLSPFTRQGEEPNEEVDKKWWDILRSTVGYIGVNEEERRKVGASPTSVKLSPESGGGYLSYLESHHHIHCLYLLYQSLHQDYYSPRSPVWQHSLERRLSHWDHCIDVLRQYVMCHADTTIVTHDWLDESDEPVPNLQNPRKCRDWDALFQWQLGRQAPASVEPFVKPSRNGEEQK